jgi:uncharacterized Zn-binding protein involved in type VI secretion
MLSPAARKGDTITAFYPPVCQFVGTVGGAPATGVITFTSLVGTGIVADVAATKVRVQGELAACLGDRVQSFLPAIGLFAGTIAGVPTTTPLPVTLSVPVTGTIDTASTKVRIEGAPAARVQDTCEMFLPPVIQCVGTISLLPALGVITFAPTPVLACITTGSAKVKMG